MRGEASPWPDTLICNLDIFSFVFDNQLFFQLVVKMQSLRVARPFPSRFVKTLAPRIQRPYSTPSAEHSYEHIQLSTPRPGVALSTSTVPAVQDP